MDHIGNGTDAIECIEAVQRLGCIGHTDGHPVSPADAHGNQSSGRGIDPLQKYFVGCLFPHEHIGGVSGVFQRRFTEHLIHGFLRIFQRCRGVSVKIRPRCVAGNAHMDHTSFSRSNFSLSGCPRWQREPDWPAVVDTPLGPPGSLLLCRFRLLRCLNRRNQPPNYHVIARSCPQGQRRGNLLLNR